MAAIDPSIIGVVAVVGTLLGAIVGVGGALLSERMRIRHEDVTRWHSERLAAYAAFMVTVDVWMKTIERMAVDDDGGFMAASKKAYAAVAPLDFLATAPLRRAAEQLLRTIEHVGFTNMDYIDAASDSTASDTEKAETSSELREWSAKLPDARVAFHDAARNELGITAIERKT